MELSRINSFLVVVEGFAVLEVSHWIGGKYLAAMLLERFPNLPWIAVSTLVTSDLSPVIAIIYMSSRLKYFPAIKIGGNAILTLMTGIVLSWSVVFLQTLFLGKEIPLAQEILDTPSPYFHLLLFSLVIWGPTIEETLVRGYFFETLRKKWNDAVALFISSLLFVIYHAIWGDVGFALFFIFLDSIVFTFVYIESGLFAAILMHMFVNSYLMYLNLNP